jgi:hypothetical protein
VTFAQGEALSAGTDEAKAAAGPDAAKPDQKKAEGSTESRYLFVTVEFDPALSPSRRRPPRPRGR